MQVEPEEVVLVRRKSKNMATSMTEQARMINDELYDTNIFDQIYYGLKVIQFISPTVLGLFDTITDIIYAAVETFSTQEIKYVFYVSLLLSPSLQFVVWTAFFASQENAKSYQDHKYTSLMQDFQALYVTKYKQNCNKATFLSYVYYIIAKLYISLWYVIYFILYSWKGILYSASAQVKILPFYLSWAYQRNLKYYNSEEMIQQYQNKKYQIRRQHVITEKNKQLQQLNNQIMMDNKSKKYESEKQRLRKMIPEIKLSPTDYITRALIQQDDNFTFKSKMENAFILRFLAMETLIKAVFESLPQLIIQYINNTQLASWSSIGIVSFSFSVLMVIINSMEMIDSLAQNQTYPLLEFMEIIYEREENESNEWIFGITSTDEIEIQAVEELEILAKANSKFYNNVSSLSLNLASDPNFIRHAICGEQRLFLYMKSMIAKLRNYKTTLILDFSDNEAFNKQTLDYVLDGLALSEIRALNLNLRTQDVEIQTCSSEIIMSLPTKIQELELSLYRWSIDDLSQFSTAFSRLKSLSIINLNLAETNISNIDRLGVTFKLLTSLKQLSLNLGGCPIQQIDKFWEMLQQSTQIQQVVINLTATNISIDKIMIINMPSISIILMYKLFIIRNNGITNIQPLIQGIEAFKGENLSINLSHNPISSKYISQNPQIELIY